MTSANMYKFVLFSLILFKVCSGNVLEIGKCVLSKFSGGIQEQQSFYSGSSSIVETKPVRSLLDCVDQCMINRLCHGSFYIEPQRSDLTGKCVMLDGTYSNQETADRTGDLMYGKLVELSIYDLDQFESSSDICSGISCASGANCYALCDQDGDFTPYPYCIADNSDCDFHEEYTNIKYYYGGRVSDGTDSGIFQYVTYPKTRDDTYIRVIYHTSFRGHHQSPGHCHQWYVTFDGSECNSPYKIGRVDYSAQTGDMHRASSIDGTCYNIASGNRRIDLRIAACPGYGNTDGYTGWHNVRQLIIMEIVPRTGPHTKPCPGLSVFNYQYQATSSSTHHHQYNAVVFQSDNYKKAASDTNLRIKFQATMRSEMFNSVSTCSRWRVFIDGTACSQDLDVVIHPTTHGCPSYHANMLVGHTIEGICEGITAGDHYIQVRTHECHYGSTQNPSYFHTGWNSGMRMHIEEVRQNARLDAVVTNDRRVLRNAFSNVYRWHYFLWNHDGDNQELKWFTYTKHNDWTALRLTSSGDHRSIYQSGYDRCTRWWFQIDNAECNNPGPVEGVYYFNYESNFHHPMQVSGVCLGKTAGDLRISYHVGNCYGYGNRGQAYTGWGSSFHLMVEEVALESDKVCNTGSPMSCD